MPVTPGVFASLVELVCGGAAFIYAMSRCKSVSWRCVLLVSILDAGAMGLVCWVPSCSQSLAAFFALGWINPCLVPVMNTFEAGVSIVGDLLCELQLLPSRWRISYATSTCFLVPREVCNSFEADAHHQLDG